MCYYIWGKPNMPSLLHQVISFYVIIQQSLAGSEQLPQDTHISICTRKVETMCNISTLTTLELFNTKGYYNHGVKIC